MTTTALSAAASRKKTPAGSPRVSVILPVRNGAHHLRRTLPVLREALPAGWELIVVDDNSTDGSAEVARLYADRVLLSPSLKGAPVARNHGARAAAGETLVFIDADIRVTRKGLERLVAALDRPGAACVFGIYSEGRYLRSPGGRFKNIWVRYSYLRSPSRVRWMNTAMAAIRKPVFWNVGGFDMKDDWLQGGNDIDFGRVVAENAGDVVLLHEVDCDHLKEMSLYGLLKNDFNRARGYFRLSLQSREIKRVAGGGWFGNISPRFMGGVVLAWLVLAGVVLALFLPGPGLALAGAALGLHLLLSLGFYGYALPRLGFLAVAAPGIFLLDHLACGAGLAVEILSRATGLLRARKPAKAAPEGAAAADLAPPAP